MSDTILVTSVEREVIEVGVAGPQGPTGATGATGATGPQGPAGTGVETLTTKGDTFGHNGAAAVRVPVGTNGQVLTADSTATPGLKWATISTTPTYATDVEVTDATKGIILKSSNSTRFRLTVSNSGLPIFTALIWLMLASLAPAQVVGIGTTASNAVATDRTGTLTWSNGFAFTNGADAITRTNLGLGQANAVTFSNVTASGGIFSNSLTVPTISSTNAGNVYMTTNLLRYRDGSGTERILLNSSDNLANLANYGAARTNLIGTNDGGWRSDLGVGQSNTPTFAGLTLGSQTNASVRVATIGTNGSLVGASGVPTGSAPTNALLVADGGGFQTTRTNLPSLMLTNSSAITAPALVVSAGGTNATVYSNVVEIKRGANNLLTVRDDGAVGAANAVDASVATGAASIHPTFGVLLGPTATLRWASSGNQYGTYDLFFYRDAAGSLGQRNGTNAPQTNNIYATWVSATNYRRLSVGISNNGVAFIRPEQAGPSTNGTNFLYISGLPATNTGLPSGVLWNSNGTVVVSP